MHISHIRISKQKISDYVDAVKPVVERYTEIKQEIKEKNTERKQLRAEQDSLPFIHVIKHQKLSEQVATLTEDLEELKSEKSMLLNSMECADAAAFSKFKKEVKNLATQMDALEQAENKFTTELDRTLERYRDLEKTVADVDAGELTDTRMELRTGKEQSAASQLQKIYGVKYDYDIVVAFHIFPFLVFLIAEIGSHTGNGEILAPAVEGRNAVILPRYQPPVFIKGGLHGKLVMLKCEVGFRCAIVRIFRADMFECCQQRHPLSARLQTLGQQGRKPPPVPPRQAAGRGCATRSASGLSGLSCRRSCRIRRSASRQRQAARH